MRVKRKKEFQIKVSVSINEKKSKIYGFSKNQWTQPTIAEFSFVDFKKPTKKHITACLKQFLVEGEWPTEKFRGYPECGFNPYRYDMPNSPLRINILSIE